MRAASQRTPSLWLTAVLAILLLACGPGADPSVESVDQVAPVEQAGAVTEPSPHGERLDESDTPTAPDGARGQAGSAWRQGTPAPLPLTEVAAAPFAGGAWTAGGLDAQGAAVSSVQVYDLTFDAWSEGPALPRAVHHSALVAAGDRLYLLGGYEGSGFDAPTAEVAVLEASSGQWQPAPSLPEARAAGAAAWDGQRLVYAGGVGPDGPVGDVWALEDGNWTVLGKLSQPREHLAAASDGAGSVWLLGGRVGGLDTNLATVELVQGGEVVAAGTLPTARGGVSGFYAGPGIGACAVGGEQPTGTFAAVECVDAQGKTTVLADLTVPRHGTGAAVLDGMALVLLGGPEPGLSTSGAVELLHLNPR